MHRTSAAVLVPVAILGLAAGCGSDPETSDRRVDAGAGTDTGPFTAVASGDVGEVCKGRPMTGAGQVDAAAPVGLAFTAWENLDRWDVDAVPLERPWVLSPDDFASTTVVVCAQGEVFEEPATCEVDGETVGIAPADWTVEVRAAATAEVLATADAPVVATDLDCPEVVPSLTTSSVPAPPDPAEVGDVADALLADL